MTYKTEVEGVGYANDRLVNIVYTKRKPNIIRIISFRKANQRQVKAYEKNIKKNIENLKN